MNFFNEQLYEHNTKLERKSKTFDMDYRPYSFETRHINFVYKQILRKKNTKFDFAELASTIQILIF